MVESLKQNSDIVLNVYNPGLSKLTTLRVKIPNVDYQAYDDNGPLETDIICPSTLYKPSDCDAYIQV